MPSNTPPPPSDAHRFSLLSGGPFSRLLGRAGLLADDGLPSVGTSVGLALAAFALPAVLALAQTLVDADYTGWGYFTDATVYSRYLIAIGTLIASERYADRRLDLLVGHFSEAQLLPESSRPAFARALERADRRSRLGVVEAILVLLALFGSGVSAEYTVETVVSSWDGRLVGGEVAPSWAGIAARFISTPLFLFLLTRWVWRFIVWALLLVQIARLPLQLSPLHPDRAAGLGFLAIYPTVFVGCVFSVSCVLSASFLKELDFVQHSEKSVWLALGAWMAINLVTLLGPLTAFASKLYRTRERARLDYGRLANRHHLPFHRRWIDSTDSDASILGSTDFSSAADLNGAIEVVREIRVVPIDRPVIVQVALAAGLPLLAVVLRQVPLAEIVKWILGSLL